MNWNKFIRLLKTDNELICTAYSRKTCGEQIVKKRKRPIDIGRSRDFKIVYSQTKSVKRGFCEQVVAADFKRFSASTKFFGGQFPTPVRKRWRATALQDADASSYAPSCAIASWTAPVPDAFGRRAIAGRLGSLLGEFSSSLRPTAASSVRRGAAAFFAKNQRTIFFQTLSRER
jgi:hypothetical protein